MNDDIIKSNRPNFAYGDFNPCPFCGNTQIYIFITPENKFYAKCERGDSCGASAFRGSNNIRDALASWNNRI